LKDLAFCAKRKDGALPNASPCPAPLNIETLIELPRVPLGHALKRLSPYSRYTAERSQASTRVGTVLEELTHMWRTARQPVDLASDLPEAAAFHNIYADFIQGVETLGKKLAEIRTEMD
jgi:hypothetical protein